MLRWKEDYINGSSLSDLDTSQFLMKLLQLRPSSCMFRIMANTILLPAEGGLPILEPVMAYDH
jgi:hypothetical protein